MKHVTRFQKIMGDRIGDFGRMTAGLFGRTPPYFDVTSHYAENYPSHSEVIFHFTPAEDEAATKFYAGLLNVKQVFDRERLWNVRGHTRSVVWGTEVEMAFAPDPILTPKEESIAPHDEPEILGTKVRIETNALLELLNAYSRDRAKFEKAFRLEIAPRPLAEVSGVTAHGLADGSKSVGGERSA